MNCPKCKCHDKLKNGIVKSKQRYRCKECNFNYTVKKKSTAVQGNKKRFALMLYTEGLGFYSIGRLLNVSHVAVIKWIKVLGKQVEEFKNDTPVEFIEMDEMHTYVGRKKTIVGHGLRLTETE